MIFHQNRVFFLFFVFVVAVIITPGFCYSKDHVLKVGYQDADGFPLVMGSGDAIGNPPGIGVDIITQVAKDLNLDLQVKRKPNKRIHVEFERGTFDGSGFYSFSEKRLKEGVYPTINGVLDKRKRVYVLSYYMYAPKDSSVRWDGKQITGVENPVVGANMGYSVVRDLKALGIRVSEVRSTRQNLKMLLFGRIHTYAVQDGTLDPVIARYKEYKHFVKVGPPIKTKEYYFMFSHQYYKNNKEMAHKIWDRIEVVRDSVISGYKKKDFMPVIE